MEPKSTTDGISGRQKQREATGGNDHEAEIDARITNYSEQRHDPKEQAEFGKF